MRPMLRKRLGIGIDHALELGGGRIVEIAGLADGLEEIALLAAQQSQQPILERPYPVDRDRIEIAVDPGIDHADLRQGRFRGQFRTIARRSPCP
jgi:hypothetical protein